MSYEKPSVNLLAEAVKAIQSGVKGMILTEGEEPAGFLSNGAYEADE